MQTYFMKVHCLTQDLGKPELRRTAWADEGNFNCGHLCGISYYFWYFIFMATHRTPFFLVKLLTFNLVGAASVNWNETFKNSVWFSLMSSEFRNKYFQWVFFAFMTNSYWPRFNKNLSFLPRYNCINRLFNQSHSQRVIFESNALRYKKSLLRNKGFTLSVELVPTKPSPQK